MTSISQPPTLPPQAANPSSTSPAGTSAPSPPAAATARSYANAATKKQASPAIASGSTASAPSPPVAVGIPSATHHATSSSVSPVNGNGKTAGLSAATPGAVVHGSNVVNGVAPSGPSAHSRKSSVTISAAGATGHLPNGGPVVGPPARTNSIQFGSINAGGSPAAAHTTLPANHLTPAVPVATPHNPRVISPQSSPSPIPQPPASGGRPPSGLPGHANAMSFGSLGGDGADGTHPRPMRPVSMPPQGPQGPLNLGPQPSHLRRESSQSTHSDASNVGIAAGQGPARPGFAPPAGRGRGYGQGYPQHGQVPYPPGPGYRGPPNQPRGNLGPQFQGQGGPMGPYPSSPHRGTRSPHLTHSVPGTPQMQQVPMANSQMQAQHYGYPPNMGPPQVNPSPSFEHRHHHDLSPPQTPHLSSHPPLWPAPDLAPEHGLMEQFLIARDMQAQYQYDAAAYAGAPYPAQPYMYPPNMYLGGPPPSSPRPPHQQHGYAGGQPPYVVGQYNNAPQPQPMSRTSSAVSEQRPSHPPTPSMTPAVSQAHPAGAGRDSPAPASTTSSNFVRPARKSAGIVIKDPKSGAIIKNFDKGPPSPAPISRSPAIVSSTPTPPPSKPADVQHTRTESKSVKSVEEKKNEMKDAIAKKLEAEKAAERQQQEAESQAAKDKHDAEKAEADAAERVKQEEAAEQKRATEEQARLAEEQREREEAAQKMEADKAAAAQAEADRTREAEAAKAASEAAATAEAAAAAAAAAAEAEPVPAATTAQESSTPVSLSVDISKLSIDSSKTAPLDDGALSANKPVSAGKRDKPAALNLTPLKTNNVEPPQPSAALQSLRSARFITRISEVSYPKAFASPNPALNSAATKGKFKYDKDFLLQFQPVFTEKPSLDWENRLKDTVGDTMDSARSQSARTPAMGPRNPSGRAGLATNFSMGNFGQGANPRPVPATSAERFAEANRSMNQPRATMNNPLAQFAGKPGGFPMGGPPPMSRTNSSTGLPTQGSGPHSPRASQNRNSRRDNMSKRNNTSEKQPRRDDEHTARTMPLTAGLELKPIQVSSTGWKPRSLAGAASATGAAGPAPGASASGHLDPDTVQRKVKSNLNKMTPEKFEKIADQILEIAAQSKDESDGRTLRQVIQLTFEKATDEAHWASMYAKFCKRMLESMSTDIKDESIRDKNGNVVAGGNLFRKYLLNRCQEEFERGWKLNLGDKPEGETEEAAMLSEEYYIAATAKRRGLGLVQFIGELYKLGMLTERIMHECVKKLVDYEGIPDEAEVESLTKLLRTIGSNLDNTDKGRPLMDVYFQRIQAMMETPELPSRLRFMLLDIVDLRKSRWHSKEANKGPQTIQEIREEALRQQAEKEAEKARQQSQRHHGGGGGRMPMGRGDARSMSGGGPYNMMPPPDTQRTTVGMDDLRRLGSKAGSRQASQGGPVSFGPTAMFNSRSSSGRKTLGPNSGLNRGGEESGASSRTGTPPAAKDKDATTHANAFSALAGLDASGEPTGATSPPPDTSSPPAVKVQPTTGDQTGRMSTDGQDEPRAGSS